MTSHLVQSALSRIPMSPIVPYSAAQRRLLGLTVFLDSFASGGIESAITAMPGSELCVLLDFLEDFAHPELASLASSIKEQTACDQTPPNVAVNPSTIDFTSLVRWDGSISSLLDLFEALAERLARLVISEPVPAVTEDVSIVKDEWFVWRAGVHAGTTVLEVGSPSPVQDGDANLFWKTVVRFEGVLSTPIETLQPYPVASLVAALCMLDLELREFAREGGRISRFLGVDHGESSVLALAKMRAEVFGEFYGPELGHP